MQDYWFQYGLGIIGNVILGVLCGVVPLAYGAAKGQPRRGLLALLTCIITGFFCGLFLAPLVAAFYVWRIYRNPKDDVDDSEEETGLMGLNLNANSADKEAGKEG